VVAADAVYTLPPRSIENACTTAGPTAEALTESPLTKVADQSAL